MSDATQSDIAELTTFFSNVGINGVDIKAGAGALEGNYIIDMAAHESEAVGAAVDVHRYNADGTSLELFTEGFVHSPASDGRAEITPVLLLPEERMDELREISDDPEAMQDVKEMTRISADAVPDDDFTRPELYETDTPGLGPQW